MTFWSPRINPEKLPPNISDQSDPKKITCDTSLLDLDLETKQITDEIYATYVAYQEFKVMHGNNFAFLVQKDKKSGIDDKHFKPIEYKKSGYRLVIKITNNSDGSSKIYDGNFQ